jgi:hypothetical protein
MNPPPITTKAQFLALSERGLLGNSMPSWSTVAEARAAGYAGKVMVRYREPNSPHMRPDVPLGEADAVIDGLVAQGARRELCYLTHMTEQVGRRINAELWRGPGGLYLNYATAQMHLRAALDRHGRHAEGSAALAVLRWACCPNSLDDLDILLDAYPDHAIELTAYDREIGSIPGRNCIVWEVRKY